MIAVDTNILIYAHRADSTWHEPARACVKALAEGRGAWSIPWPCIHEFIAVATHPRIYNPPTGLSAAIDQVDAWLESPTVVLLSEKEDHWEHLRHFVERARINGPRVHDARIAALCLAHGVRELWTADRDFHAFAGVFARNPFVSERPSS